VNVQLEFAPVTCVVYGNLNSKDTRGKCAVRHGREGQLAFQQDPDFFVILRLCVASLHLRYLPLQQSQLRVKIFVTLAKLLLAYYTIQIQFKQAFFF